MTVWMPSEWTRDARRSVGAEPVGDGDPGEPGRPADAAGFAGPAAGIPPEPRKPPDAETPPLATTAAGRDGSPPLVKTPWPWFAVRKEERGSAPAGPVDREVDPPTAVLPVIPSDPGPPAGPPRGVGVRPHPQGRQDERRRSGGTGNGSPGDGGAGSGAGAVELPAGTRGSGGGPDGSSAEDVPVQGGTTPLPKRVPRTPPPPFGAVTSAGGASLFEPPSRGPASKQLRPSAALPPAMPSRRGAGADSTPATEPLTPAADQPARRRAEVGGLWAGAAAARGDERVVSAGEPSADRANRWSGASRAGRREGWDFTAPAANPNVRPADPPAGRWSGTSAPADAPAPAAGADHAGGDWGLSGPAPEASVPAGDRAGGGWGPTAAEPAPVARWWDGFAAGDPGRPDAGVREAADRERGADDAGGREATKDTGTYEDDATEVLGPLDVGLWTLQAREAVAAPERVRGRTAVREPRDRDRGRDRRGQDAADRHPATVGAAGGGGDRGRPPDRPTGGSGSGSAAGRRPHPTGDRVRPVVRGIAQTFITLGLVLLLFSVYEVWFTGVLNGRSQDRLKSQLEKQWETGDDPVVATRRPARPGAKVRSIPLGDGFALIYIPAFGRDYVYTVVEGTDPAELDEGPGHYPDSALPGEVGNFAVAGHRVGKGSPFLNLDKLRAGSPIVIRTRTHWYTYRVLGDPGANDPTVAGPLGVPGMRIVSPADVGVIAPVPGRAGAEPTQRLLTLTTCHPKFSARQRLVIHARLDGAPLPTSKGLPPALKG